MNILSFLLIILFTATCIVAEDLPFQFQYNVKYFAYLNDSQYKSNEIIFYKNNQFIYTKTPYYPCQGTWEWNEKLHKLSLNYYDQTQIWTVWKAKKNGNIPVANVSTYRSHSYLLAKVINSFRLATDNGAIDPTSYDINQVYNRDFYGNHELADHVAPVTDKSEPSAPNSDNHYDQDNYLSFSEYPEHSDRMAPVTDEGEPLAGAAAAIDPNSYSLHNQVFNWGVFGNRELADRMAPVTDEGEPSAPNYNNYNEQDYYTGTSDYSVLDDFIPEDYHIDFDPTFK